MNETLAKMLPDLFATLRRCFAAWITKDTWHEQNSDHVTRAKAIDDFLSRDDE